MRYLLAIIAFFATLAATLTAAAFALISFVGPHSPAMSATGELIVYGLAGLAVVMLPALAARAVVRSGQEDEE